MNISGHHLIGYQEVAGNSGQTFRAVNPATGQELPIAFAEGSQSEAELALELAASAFLNLRNFSKDRHAALCEAIAEKIAASENEMMAVCAEETGYPTPRLAGEFARTVNQLRAFAKVAQAGNWIDATIDHADPERTPLPKPDVRRMRMPVGPVVVFGASNFPFALSCAGGDTASALAAGCPVIVKGHPSHPGTSELAARAILSALKEAGYPEGCFSLLQGRSNELGAALVKDPRTAAVGFTGSFRGGRALCEIAAARPLPIPVYAEMGSFNPQFVFPGRLHDDAAGFANALFGSVTLGNGQFCTNPGMVFVPQGEATEAFLQAYRDKVATASDSPMLNAGICSAYQLGLQKLIDHEQVEVVGGVTTSGQGCQVTPALAVTTESVFVANRAAFEEEIFGPVTIVVICGDTASYRNIASTLPGQLASSLHGNEKDLIDAEDLLRDLAQIAGRIVVNGFPTGIEICHAMHHGGTFPASSSAQFTSIGLNAIARWGRPVCFQDIPDQLLPDALKESNPLSINRLVDGQMIVPA